MSWHVIPSGERGEWRKSRRWNVKVCRSWVRGGNIMAVQHHHHHHSSSTLSTRSCDWIENYFRGIIDCLTSKLCWVVTKAVGRECDVATVTSWFKEFLTEKTRERRHYISQWSFWDGIWAAHWNGDGEIEKIFIRAEFLSENEEW